MNIEIANRLVELRKKHGLSQEELANKLGISRQAVSKWERAESSPDTDNLICLAKLYGVSLDELLDCDKDIDEIAEEKRKDEKEKRKEGTVYRDKNTTVKIENGEMVDTYSTLGKDIHFSEITFPSYDGRDTYLEMQNVITENLYKLWFSMEKVKSIVWWNLVDGTAVKKANADAAFDENYFGGGLFKNDFTPKPAFKTIENLIKNEWHTKETIVTNNKGYASFTGFNGEYDVVIKKGKDSVKRTIKVAKDNPIIVLQLD